MSDPHSLPIQGTVLTPSSGVDYRKALYRFSDSAILEPKYIFLPSAVSDIPVILSYAASQSPPIEVAVKSGGTRSLPWASSKGGLVIDLAGLHNVVVSQDKQSVKVQGGALWGDVYEEAEKTEVHVVGAHFWFIGVAGFLLSGGYSRLGGDHGLGVDNILSATVVLADGRVIKTSASEEPDLFWAIRGGGNQFGIVVEFVLKAFPAIPSITVGSLVYHETEIEKLMSVIQHWKKTHTVEERMALGFSRIAPHFEPTAMLMTYVSGDTARAEKVLHPFRDTLKPIADISVTLPNLFAVTHVADANFESIPNRINLQGAIVSDIWMDTVVEMWNRWRKFTANDDCHQTSILWEIDRPEKISVAGKADTAFHARDPHYCILVYGINRLPTSDDSIHAFVSSSVNYIRKADALKTGKDLGIPLCYARGDEAPEDVFGTNLPRLRKLKAKYDPTNVWSKGFVIEPDFD